MKCGECKKTDGLVYTSIPPQVKCLFTCKFHFYDDKCDIIADMVEVVRYKDCKKYIPCQKLPIGTSKWCDLFDRATCEMNYCGWGEKREDAGE